MKKLKVYLAGPLFSVAEREFNRRLVTGLRRKVPNITLIMPQTYAKKISGQDSFMEKIFRYCIESIDQADVLLCILDGPDVDSGTCIEMGYAYAQGKTIIGIRTDFRNSEDRGVNLMVSNVCRRMIWLRDSDVTQAQLLNEIADTLKQAAARE